VIICAFDTETTGLYDPIRLVELGVVLFELRSDWSFFERASVSLIIRPEGFTIPEKAASIHGITTEIALHFGISVISAISVLTNLWSKADILIAHNFEYDDKVINGEIIRLGRNSNLRRPPTICTKDLSAPILNIPPTPRMISSGYGGMPKAPKLEECYRFFFNEEIIGAHSALVDARACARVFAEIKRRKGE
jgi:DNA polymerase-3 subunit epsilon